jgi:hypothetical protein
MTQQQVKCGRCVLLQVLRLGELSQINERCLDLQRSKASSSRKAAALGTTNTSDGPTPTAADSSSTGASSKGVVGFMQQPGRQRGKQRQRQNKAGCPFLSVEGGAAGWEEFADLVLAAPIDVEELASMGRRKKVGTLSAAVDPAAQAIRAVDPLCIVAELYKNLSDPCTNCTSARHVRLAALAASRQALPASCWL